MTALLNVEFRSRRRVESKAWRTIQDHHVVAKVKPNAMSLNSKATLSPNSNSTIASRRAVSTSTRSYRPNISERSHEAVRRLSNNSINNKRVHRCSLHCNKPLLNYNSNNNYILSSCSARVSHASLAGRQPDIGLELEGDDQSFYGLASATALQSRPASSPDTVR